MRLIVSFSKTGPARFISHLDLQRLWQRVLKIAGVQMQMSKGFNPHPKMRFALPLATGYESRGELLEISVLTPVTPGDLQVRLNAILPEGLLVVACQEAPENMPKLTAMVAGLGYELYFAKEPDMEKAERILAGNSIVEQKDKKFNIKDFLIYWHQDKKILQLRLHVQNQVTVRPELAAAHLFPESPLLRVIRTEFFTCFDGDLPVGLKSLDC